jgi:hypothetical protein
MDNHRHGEDGIILYDESPAAAEVEAVEVAAGADVEIARVNAERDLALAKLDIKREELWQEARVVELEGQLAGIRETLQTLMPEPEPEPAPAPAPEPVVIEPPVDDVAPAPEPVEAAEEPAPKKSKGYWAGYS